MKNPKDFTVRLQWPPSSSTTPDVAISLTIDFDAKEVIRKCRVNGQWVKEETTKPNFPFKSNKSEQYFEVKLEVNENRFIVSFNGNYSVNMCREYPTIVCLICLKSMETFISFMLSLTLQKSIEYSFYISFSKILSNF